MHALAMPVAARGTRAEFTQLASPSRVALTLAKRLGPHAVLPALVLLLVARFATPTGLAVADPVIAQAPTRACAWARPDGAVSVGPA